MTHKTDCCGRPIQTPYCPYCGESSRGEQVLRGMDIDEIISERIYGPDVLVDCDEFFCGYGLTVTEIGMEPNKHKVTIVSEKINGDLICDITMTRPECVRLLLGCGILVQV